MTTSIARVVTDRASSYLQQLCKHSAHRLPVEYTPTMGRIPLPTGTCRLTANDDLLTLHAEAEDAAWLADLQNVVGRHLPRSARDRMAPR